MKPFLKDQPYFLCSYEKRDCGGVRVLNNQEIISARNENRVFNRSYVNFMGFNTDLYNMDIFVISVKENLLRTVILLLFKIKQMIISFKTV